MRRSCKTSLLAIVALVLVLVAAMAGKSLSNTGATSRILAWGQYVSPHAHQPPGNSIEAIEHSRQFGYDGIELDVQISGDGHIVLMHDSTLDATTNGTGPVANHTLKQLRELSLGAWQGEEVRIPTLAQAIDSYETGTILIDWRIEQGFEQHLARVINTRAPDIMVSAHDRAAALRLKRELPGARILLKTYLPVDRLPVDQVAGLDGLMIDGRNGVPEELLEHLHAQGMILVTFVHTEDLGRWHLWKQMRQGVDFILTTRPDWARAYPF